MKRVMLLLLSLILIGSLGIGMGAVLRHLFPIRTATEWDTEEHVAIVRYSDGREVIEPLSEFWWAE